MAGHFQVRWGYIWLAVALSLGTVATDAGAKQSAAFVDRPEFHAFIARMSERHGFDKEGLTELFRKIKPRPDIIQAISHPAEAQPWYKYRPIFVTPSRIRGGVAFWREHEKTLARAEKIYGVPPEIIVAIIGVETRYGKYKGRYPVLEALSTLAFDYPKRAEFFRSELEQYLLLTREEKLDPLSIRGSYAGAMGGPQFISSSYRRYAVDFNKDGKRNLWNDYADMIGSVANYFKVHGWRPGEPIARRARVNGDGHEKLAALGIEPRHSIARIRKMGVEPVDRIDDTKRAALITLETEDGTEHWLGLQNFYVITRYNHSELYAMAVFQLSQAIAAERRRALDATDTNQ